MPGGVHRDAGARLQPKIPRVLPAGRGTFRVRNRVGPNRGFVRSFVLALLFIRASTRLKREARARMRWWRRLQSVILRMRSVRHWCLRGLARCARSEISLVRERRLSTRCVYRGCLTRLQLCCCGGGRVDQMNEKTNECGPTGPKNELNGRTLPAERHARVRRGVVRVVPVVAQTPRGGAGGAAEPRTSTSHESFSLANPRALGPHRGRRRGRACVLTLGHKSALSGRC